MEQKYGEFVGVENLHYAIVLEDSEAEYIADTPEYLAPAAEISGEAETENTTTYYDNQPANNYVTEGATTLNITVSGVPADKAAILLGKKYDAVSGRVLDTGEPDPPDCALSFRFNRGKNGYRYYQYLKGTFSGGTEEAASKSNTIDVRTYQLTFTAVATTHLWEIDGEMKPLKRILADTSDHVFDPTGWFEQVQTPDTTTNPDPLSLVNSVPDADATGISVDASVVLTFSNKIKNENVFLVNSPNGAILSTVKSWDETGKILTLTPESTLESGKRHAAVLTGVVDIYGQKLENNLIYFTTD